MKIAGVVSVGELSHSEHTCLTESRELDLITITLDSPVFILFSLAFGTYCSDIFCKIWNVHQKIFCY